MAIKVGEKIPNVKLQTVRDGVFETVWTDDFFKGKTVVLFAVPGAFTSVCSDHHLPGYIELSDHLKSRGADLVAGTAVNDLEVLTAWYKAQRVSDKIVPLADGNGDFARALGLELDCRDFGMGIRSQRYAAVVRDGVLAALNVDAPGEVVRSSAAAILQSL
ncbi:MAG TPA: redoxin family protein [Thermoanaerobaculia bacterium]|nr:redoxin family protein [Thermoanaerobaculia bacterium]